MPSRPRTHFIRLAATLFAVILLGTTSPDARAEPPQLPDRGICAHRGASHTHPENTLVAFHEALRLGAHMIEFDVRRSRDGELVLMHDRTVNRTTDGKGAVAKLTLAELRELNAGSWKGEEFAGEGVPTLDEALAMMPENVWLNVHLKGDAALAEEATRRIVAHDRLHQAFLACGKESAEAARKVDSRILICNMTRDPDALKYAKETLNSGANYIQFLARQTLDPQAAELLQQNGVRINFCCTNDPDQLSKLFEAGMQFILVDDVGAMLDEAKRLGIERIEPSYR